MVYDLGITRSSDSGWYVFELQPDRQSADRKNKHIFFITDDTKLNTTPKFLKVHFIMVSKENKKSLYRL